MDTTSPTIPAETACHVLWHYGVEGGYQPGSFTQRLMQAVDAADVVNTARLRAAYPELVDAMSLAGSSVDGIAKLQRIATGAGPLGCTCGDTAGPFDLTTGRCETCAEAAA